jgi:hypothetical protein
MFAPRNIDSYPMEVFASRLDTRQYLKRFRGVFIGQCFGRDRFRLLPREESGE